MQISTKTNTDHYHVIIVGMGPTGLVLANLLGLAKLRVLILDRFLEPYDLPRAVHLDDEIMRIFQVIGVANEMAYTASSRQNELEELSTKVSTLAGGKLTQLTEDKTSLVTRLLSF